jgi:natural product precursor
MKKLNTLILKEKADVLNEQEMKMLAGGSYGGDDEFIMKCNQSDNSTWIYVSACPETANAAEELCGDNFAPNNNSCVSY